MLFNNKDVFEQVILKVSGETGIDAAIIEKDYLNVKVFEMQTYSADI